MGEDFIDSDQNASEYTARIFNTSSVSKAFNTIFAEHLKDRTFDNKEKSVIPFAA